ncbi:MAG: NAD(P)H-binding protein [Bacteroidota bacterium]
MISNSLTQKVLVAGATGLVGSALLDILINEITIQKIVVVGRTKPVNKSPKIEFVMTDFENPMELAPHFIEVHTVFCCIGTIIKTAGSQEAFRNVDYGIPVALAKLASENQVKSMIVISSIGANAQSNNFYLKTKGEMEEAVASCKIQKTAFLRPSLINGPRREFRWKELVSKIFLTMFSFLLQGRFKRYRSINHDVIAMAMWKISNSANNTSVYESDEIQWIGG